MVKTCCIVGKQDIVSTSQVFIGGKLRIESIFDLNQGSCFSQIECGKLFLLSANVSLKFFFLLEVFKAETSVETRTKLLTKEFDLSRHSKAVC